MTWLPSSVFRALRPTDDAVRRLLAEQAERPFSYPHVGATLGTLPQGHRVARHRIVLGRGADAFRRAVAAVRSWKMHAIPGIELLWPTTAIAIGSTVAVRARVGPLWALNACRVVYTIDEPRRFGFGYGTLPAHAVCGEERFVVEWEETGDEVAYELLAFSRPHGALLWAAAPLIRREQGRFAAESKASMLRAVATAP